jgi:hypothetical protein
MAGPRQPTHVLMHGQRAFAEPRALRKDLEHGEAQQRGLSDEKALSQGDATRVGVQFDNERTWRLIIEIQPL